MMPDTLPQLAIIGAGGHGRVVADTALAMRRWSQIFFLDDDDSLTTVLGLPVAGTPERLYTELKPAEVEVVIAVGNNGVRQRLFERLKTQGFTLPVICHPSAVVSPFADIAEGCVIFAQAVVQAGSRIEAGVIINTAATVDHDCQIRAFAHISPGAHLAGGTQVGQQSWLGIGCCTRQQIHIGHHVMVGAGAVVVSHVSDGLTVVGNPAKAI